MFNYALPVKLEDCESFSCGARDFRTAATALRHYNGNLPFEYNAYIAGLLLQQDLTPQQVLSFYSSDKGEEQQNLTWWNMLFALSFANKNLYFITLKGDYETCKSKALDTQDFLSTASDTQRRAFAQSPQYVYTGLQKAEMLEECEGILGLQKAKILEECGGITAPVHVFAWKFSAKFFNFKGPYVPLSARQLIAQQIAPAPINNRLVRFYKNALQKMPADLLKEWRQTYPGINRQMFLYDGGILEKEIADKYGGYFIDAALGALEKAKAPRVIVPAGYM